MSLAKTQELWAAREMLLTLTKRRPRAAHFHRLSDANGPISGYSRSKARCRTNEEREAAVLQNRKSKVAEAVKAIREFHTLGRMLPKKQLHKDAYEMHTIDEQARKLGINPDTVRKARQFADPKVGYTMSEVNELCRRIVAVQAGQDRNKAVFGRTHVIRLLSVIKQRRSNLVERALRDGWSTAVLEAEIAARYGSRKDGGRARRLPTNVLGLLTQIEQFCESWRRWVEQITPDADTRDVPTSPPSLHALPARVRRLVVTTDVAMTKLHLKTTDELTVRRPRRTVRHRFRKPASAN